MDSVLLESLNSTSSLALQRAVNNYLQHLIRCQTVFIVFISEDTSEGLIQIIGDDILEKEFRFSLQSKLRHKESDTVFDKTDAIQNDIQSVLKSVLIPYPKYLLGVPISHPERDGYVIFMVYLCDSNWKFDDNEYTISVQVKECFSSCSAILLNAFNLLEEKKKKEMYHNLLQMANQILLKIGDYSEILKEIVKQARSLLNAERCSLYLLNEDKTELVSKVFDGIYSDQVHEIRIPAHFGVVGLVAMTGEVVNIHNAQTFPLFQKNIDQATGIRTRNVLCFPIRDDHNQVAGVAEVCNKTNSLHFNSIDEEAAETLGTYCSIALMHSIIFRKMNYMKARSRVSSEMLTYQLGNRKNDVAHLFESMPNQNYDLMHDFQWFSRRVDETFSLCCTFKMFEILGFVGLWNISSSTLANFILCVKNGYRALPYHNWFHAFSVAHCAYLLMKELGILSHCLITELEGVAFLVSALCHDLDHRGTTNVFQVETNNSLASLYNSDGSILERHHFGQTLLILNMDCCNIFENLTPNQYVRVISYIRDMIIATDILQHVKTLPEEQKMSQAGYDPSKKQHRNLLLSLMMTCCDLNDQLKGWLYCRDIAVMIYTEFFKQGDLEKEMGITPMEMMNREIAFVPKLQLDFLNGLFLPGYRVLCRIFPPMNVYIDTVENTIDCWNKATEWFNTVGIPKNQSLEYITSPELEKYVLESYV